MAISFLQVPLGNKVPAVMVEFDTSKAQQGASIKPYNALIIGQQLSDASKAEKQIDKVTSESQARQYYGKGSQLFHMISAFIAANSGINEINAISLADGAAVKAAGFYEILTPPTAAGTLSVMIAGRRYRIAVADADTEADIISNLVDEIDADEDRMVTVVINATPEIMDITARNGGEVSNDLDIRENYFEGEELPTGVTSTITQAAGGSGNPAITNVITAMGEKQYDVIVMPYSDAANLLLMKTV